MFVCYTDGAKELSQNLEEIFQIYRIDLRKENKNQTSENKRAVL